MAIATKIEDFMTKASFIRRMFEEGLRMKQELGAENVFDFTLGNPILEPPREFQEELRRLVNSEQAGLHRYMPNAGHMGTREQVSHYLAKDTGTPVEAQDVIMTVGAGGALNVSLKALLDPGDQVLAIVPYFPEYRFYVDNHGGELVLVESTPDFDLDLSAIEAAITERTEALILNSPNNPTGRMYTKERLAELGVLLRKKEAAFGRPITILSDEPYRKIVFDGRKPPAIFDAHRNTVLITSHSKDLGLPGERIGFAAISPAHQDRKALQGAMTFTNRILGFVNAPSLIQHAVAPVQAASVPVAVYQELRDLLMSVLVEAGLEVRKPEGAFYLFPRSPIDDDQAFVDLLKQQRVLAVPGVGFGRAGHLRLAFCVRRAEIENARQGITLAVQAARKK